MKRTCRLGVWVTHAVLWCVEASEFFPVQVARAVRCVVVCVREMCLTVRATAMIAAAMSVVRGMAIVNLGHD